MSFQVILKCNVNDSSFMISQVYNMVLVSICTYYAVLTRKVLIFDTSCNRHLIWTHCRSRRISTRPSLLASPCTLHALFGWLSCLSTFPLGIPSRFVSFKIDVLHKALMFYLDSNHHALHIDILQRLHNALLPVFAQALHHRLPGTAVYCIATEFF